jgi:UDP-N-acetylglucosamine 2-epimerase
LRVLSIIGGRPHLIKAEAVHRDLIASGWTHLSLRVGLADRSDYPDEADFDLPTPLRRVFVEDSGPLAVGVAEGLLSARADVILLYGDLITSHFALPAALASGVRVVHVESGYRSRDLNDFEERTRILCDHAADTRLAYTEAMVANLLAEGIPRASIATIADPARATLLWHLGGNARRIADEGAAGVLTLHRDETVHNESRLRRLIEEIGALSHEHPLHLILYRRTERYLSEYGLLRELERDSKVTITSTLSYDRYLELLRRAPFVVTDSSGLQDDCATLGVPCLVVREATSRPLAEHSRLVPRIDGDRRSLLELVNEMVRESAGDASQQPDSGTSDRVRIADALVGVFD